MQTTLLILFIIRFRWSGSAEIKELIRYLSVYGPSTLTKNALSISDRLIKECLNKHDRGFVQYQPLRTLHVLLTLSIK